MQARQVVSKFKCTNSSVQNFLSHIFCSTIMHIFSSFKPEASSRPFSPRGCKGRSPLHEITLVSPFPFGEGGQGAILPLRGRGAEKQAKGRGGRREKGKPPRQIPGWLGEPTAPQRTVSATRSINRLRQSRARRSAMCTMASPVAEPCPFMTGLRTPSRRAPPCVL